MLQVGMFEHFLEFVWGWGGEHARVSPGAKRSPPVNACSHLYTIMLLMGVMPKWNAFVRGS